MCMNIWLVTIGEHLPIQQKKRKMRTAYLADELLERGHSVRWVTSAFDHFEKSWIVSKDTEIKLNQNFTITLLKGRGYKKNISVARFLDHRILARKFKKNAINYNQPDMIIVSMPPYDLALEAIKFAKKFDIPVLIDIRDRWPDIFLDKSPLPKKITKLFLVNEYYQLKKSLKEVTGIIAVSETFMAWSLNYAKRQPSNLDKVFWLGYKKKETIIVSKNFNFNQTMDLIKDKFIIVFVGTFEEFHDPSILIDCAKLIAAEEKIHFVLAGDGKFRKEIEKKAAGLCNATITGWLEHDEIEKLLNQSAIGVCTSAYMTDLFPNKAFCYFAHGLPVISAFEGDLKNLIETYQVGLYYPPNDLKALMENIKVLVNDNCLYEKFSANARRLFNEKFDGEIIYKNYANHVEKIAEISNKTRKVKKELL